MLRIGIVAVLALVGTSAQTLAQSEHAWKLSRINGKAWIEAPGHEAFRVKRNRYLFPGQTLNTNARARLLLIRGKERIQVGSNTTLFLPPFNEMEPGKTIIRQRAGTIHLSVDKKNAKHFSVQTPYMVAAVKGTQFSVSLKAGTAGVRVHEGIVEVRNLQTNRVEDITAGQSVNIMNIGARPAHMQVFDRGEDNPKASALAAPQDEFVKEGKEGFVSTTFSLATSILGAILGFIASVINGTTNAIAGVVTSAITSILQMLGLESSLTPMIQKVLMAAFVVIALASSAAYWKLRRR